MTKENCFESGSSGGTKAIEVKGNKRKHSPPTRSITIDDISIVVDPTVAKLGDSSVNHIFM